MGYINNVESYFIKEAQKSFENQIPFENGMETTVFCLIQKILEQEENGAFQIKVPMRELGSSDYTQHFADFCGAIAFAAGLYVYQNNKENPSPEIQPQELFFNNKMFIRKGEYSIPYAAYGSKNPPIHHLNNNYYWPRLLPEDKFQYNSQNGEREIRSYLNWVQLFTNKGRILNNVNKKILIISYTEIDASKWSKSIPHCVIKEGGTIAYSSPIEPLLYFARDAKQAEEITAQNIFDTVIFIGDKKFISGGRWSLRHKLFRKIIYIGLNNADNAKLFYTFSPSEIFQLYKIGENSISFKHQIAESEKLKQAVENFIIKADNLSSNAGKVFFPLLSLLNRTAPIEKDVKLKMEEWFEEFLLSKVSASSDNTLDEVEAAYSQILNALENGNEEKITLLKKLLPSDKKINTYLIVSQKDEAKFFKKEFQIKNENIIEIKRFAKKTRNIAYKKHNKPNNLYIFLAYDKKYDDLLQMLDGFTLLGTRLFIGPKDGRFERIVSERENSFNKLLADESRSNITGIIFNIPVATNNFTETLSLEHFNYDDTDSFSFNRVNQVENYEIITIENERIVISGNVLIDNHIQDLDELEPGDEFIYYLHQNEIFDAIFKILQPELHADIEKNSNNWKNNLKELLKTSFNNNIKELFTALTENGWKSELNTLKQYLTENSTTLFPRRKNLMALKKLCEEFENIDSAKSFLLAYDNIRKAKQALSNSNNLGRLISRNLLQYAAGEDVSEFKKALNEDIWERLLNTCLKKAVANSIKKLKS